MKQTSVRETVSRLWADEVLPSLSGLVEIPALSQSFDPDWDANGQLAAAVEHVRSWITARNLPGATIDVIRVEDRSPVLLVDVPATPGAEDRGTVLLYGHLDKQPPVGGWSDGLGPWQPVIRDGRLYGRGSADDGYAGYAATTALEAVHAAGGQHARSVILLETGEESGSPDLPLYLERLADRLGRVSFVICLDSGGNDYERLWLTTSLRGMVQVHATVRVLDSAQHSGLASGIVPSSFRILRRLLERIEDAETGEIKLAELNVEIPANRVAEAKGAAEATPGEIKTAFPLADGMRPVSEDDVELLLNNSWRPTLSVIGASGFPEPANAGNVLRDSTTLALSLRLPPRMCRTRRGSSCPVSSMPAGGTRPRPRRGWRRRWTGSAPRFSAPRQGVWALAARSRSWACSRRSARRRSSWSPARSARTRTHTCPTNG